ncbi:MAG TPA: AAA family ATPase [Blastocatellia bacterium]|nr:AAA family ATPase [Blastocatellia bacterium]HMV85676.1 AAA family ATPase [Blastocatellia bacterium]HMX25547.1 AAA family ATPase [Blastocatellia bacterium]HNG33434.1 AAA family ATPase [Blastocatellia bacterium]
MSQTENPVSTPGRLPTWADEILWKYRSGEASHFLLYHNIYDLTRSRNGYLPLPDFLQQELLLNKQVVFYNRSEGITFHPREVFQTLLEQERAVNPQFNASAAGQLPRDPARALPMIERFLQQTDNSAVVINFVETVFPAGEISHLSGEDRNSLVAIQRWMTTPGFMEKDKLVLLIAESLSDVHPRVRENARLTTIRIPYPDEAERFDFIQSTLTAAPINQIEMTVELIAELTNGLNLIHLQSLLSAARRSHDGLSFADLRLKKKEIIEAECAGLIEFVAPRYGLDSVGGLRQAKAYMRDIAETIRQGHHEEAPMGILICGPVGTGKTFLAECFAKDCGLNVVEFKNFRDKWVGSTEGNLEKILYLLQTLAPIVVLIDEADAALGSRETDGDSGVNQRVFSKIAAAMSNTANRGRILWILMTSRPDRLPIDLKRQGRCEEHISLFFPENAEERREIAEAMARKNKIDHQITNWGPITNSHIHLSGADIESILIRARRVARIAGQPKVTNENLSFVTSEFTPARDEVAIEYQELVAAREATSRAMIPPNYRTMTGAEIVRRMEMLRPLIK